MMVRARQRGQILILLAGWLFFGGGASSALIAYDRPASQMKQGIKRVIGGGDRREAILSDIDNWESGQEKRSEEVGKNREQLFEMMRRKDAQLSDLEPILAKLDKAFVVMDWDFLHLRFRVKEKVTRAEWAEIVARPNP